MNFREENSQLKLDKDGFGENAEKNMAHVFSSDALNDFLAKNQFSHVVRAHDAQKEKVQVNFNPWINIHSWL